MRLTLAPPASTRPPRHAHTTACTHPSHSSSCHRKQAPLPLYSTLLHLWLLPPFCFLLLLLLSTLLHRVLQLVCRAQHLLRRDAVWRAGGCAGMSLPGQTQHPHGVVSRCVWCAGQTAQACVWVRRECIHQQRQLVHWQRQQPAVSARDLRLPSAADYHSLCTPLLLPAHPSHAHTPPNLPHTTRCCVNGHSLAGQPWGSG